MPIQTTISEKRPTGPDRGREDKRMDRASVRNAILRSLGKPDRRPGEVVEHRLGLSVQM